MTDFFTLQSECFTLSYKIHHRSLRVVLFYKRELVLQLLLQSWFGRQSRVIEFSVDECCIKDL